MERSAGSDPLRSQCVAAKPGTGRTVQLHPQEALLQQARALQQSEAFAGSRERRGWWSTGWRGGPTGNPPVPLLRARQDEIPVVPGGHGGQPDPGGRQGRSAGRPANTCGGSSAGSALRAGTIRSALEIVPARLGQILTPALLALASLPEYTSPNKGFRPAF